MESYIEKAETLSRQFGISRADAMKALEECDGDILDTVSSLECQGIIKTTSATFNTGTSAQKPRSAEHSYRSEGRRVDYNPEAEVKNDFSNLKSKAAALLKKSIDYKLSVIKGEKNIIQMPVLVVIVMLLAAFWVTVPLLAAGLLAGCRYELSVD